MLVYLVCALTVIAIHPRTNYADWSEWVLSPFLSASLGLFFLALFSHMWVGLRDVVLDYAKPDWLRHGLLAALAVALLGLTAWAGLVLFT